MAFVQEQIKISYFAYIALFKNKKSICLFSVLINFSIFGTFKSETCTQRSRLSK